MILKLGILTQPFIIFSFTHFNMTYFIIYLLIGLFFAFIHHNMFVEVAKQIVSPERFYKVLFLSQLTTVVIWPILAINLLLSWMS